MAQAASAVASDNVLFGIHPPSDCHAEVIRTLRYYQVRSPKEMTPTEMHVRYNRALDELEEESNWFDDEQSFINIFYFLNLPRWVRTNTFVRLSEGSCRFLASKYGRNSRMKRALLSLLVDFYGEVEFEDQCHYNCILKAACGLAEAELELQYDRLMRDQIALFDDDIEGVNLVLWAISKLMSVQCAFTADRKSRQRVARLLILVLLHFPYDSTCNLVRPRALLRTIKDCLYSIGFYDVLQQDLLLAVSQIAAKEAPRTKAKTIIKLFFKRIVNTGGLSSESADNILMRLCLRLYKFADDESLITATREIVSRILRDYPGLFRKFRIGLSQVWHKYGSLFDHEYDDELSMVFQP